MIDFRQVLASYHLGLLRVNDPSEGRSDELTASSIRYDLGRRLLVWWRPMPPARDGARAEAQAEVPFSAWGSASLLDSHSLSGLGV
jgi:hypothetical protein